MRLLTRYLAREIYLSIALVFAALLALFTFLELIRELNNLGQGGYHFGYVLAYVALSIPGSVYELAPVATLIGTIVALVQMAANSELTIYRASGASLWQMVAAVFKIAVPLVVLIFLCSEFVAPNCERMAKQLRMKAQNAQVTLKEFRSGVWLKDERNFVNVKNVMLDTSLSDINIYRFDEKQRLTSITHAQRAQFVAEGLWTLENVQETHFDRQQVRMSKLASQEWRSGITPGILSVMLVVPEQMSAWDLYQYTNHLIENKQKSTRYRIAMWNKLVHPFSLFVMMLLALPFAAHHRRAGGVGGMIFMGIVLGLTYHFVGRLFANLGALNDWQPFVSATAVTALFMLCAAVMLWKTERR